MSVAPPELLLGPLLRYVDGTSATVWLETSAPAVVEVSAGGARASSRTWGVHGHHYALLVLEGLERASTTPYAVDLDGVRAWPPSQSGDDRLAAAFAGVPDSTIRTLRGDGRLRLAFGSCRRSEPFDAAGMRTYGADALVQMALQMVESAVARHAGGAGVSGVDGAARADGARATDGPATWPWPDALLFAGDQIYADQPPESMKERLRAAHRDGPRATVPDQVGTFEEYTWLYRESWTTPAVRWLLSTVPTAMLLDDHDLRDDWNTSQAWRDRMTTEPWWRDRVLGAFGSYLVYQHLGNLSPAQLVRDGVLAALVAAPDDDARSAVLDDVAWRADAERDSARWSFTREYGDEGQVVRLLAVDSRCSRDLRPDHRRILDEAEWAWVQDQATAPPAEGRLAHLLVASPLPVLLMHGIHDVEGWDERLANPRGRRSRRLVAAAEAVRQGVDLEHWSAFRHSFDALVGLLGEVVSAPDAPDSVLLLGGDVHCSYAARAHLEGVEHPGTAIHQLVMSPFRNPLHGALKVANGLAERPAVRALCARLARWAGVRPSGVRWEVEQGPWFENGVMTVVVDGPDAHLEVDHYRVRDGVVLRRSTSAPLTAAAGRPAPAALAGAAADRT